jgi:RNA polymerase sigma-70 factor (ECF subfamily)
LVHALDAQIFQQARQQGGRLRSLLLTCLQNYRRNAVRRDHAAKRGGAPAVALEDRAGAESRLEQFTTHTETPERIFDRDWALELIRHVIEQLQREQVAAGHGKRFQILAAHLMEKDSAVAHFDLASQLGISEGAARIALHRLRQRCQQLVNSELRKLVDSPEEVAAELRHLVSVLARPSTLLTN